MVPTLALPDPALPETTNGPTFSEQALPDALQRALAERGYVTPTPIQAEIIPHVLAGRDVIGKAQTGTGKTAAFALPLLARLDFTRRGGPQVLVLTPTRELAGQVAEACAAYGRYLPGLKIAAVYGGAGYGEQLRALRHGAQVIVGTPGRVMDHMKRGSLDLSDLSCLVLDEGDEMLRMGFIDDVEWVLARAPAGRQMALFSATMPHKIRNIAQRYLNNPIEIRIKAATATATTVRQRYWLVRGVPKIEALARFVEGEATDGVLVFTRTKMATVDVAGELHARGIAAAPLNGDMVQAQRERAVEQFKRGEINVLVATDVAARGLDVQCISHVINYDIPGDAESYVHRVGRTGRAGRSGEAILFVHPRERHALRELERHSKAVIPETQLPNVDAINAIRKQRFAQRIVDAAGGNLADFEDLINTVVADHDLDPLRAAAALASLVQGEQPLFLKEVSQPRGFWGQDPYGEERGGKRRNRKPAETDSTHYRIEVGRKHGTQPGMIVGAIANELSIPGHAINSICIHDTYSTLTLPNGMSAQVLNALRRIRVVGRPLAAERLENPPPPPDRHRGPRSDRRYHPGARDSLNRRQQRRKQAR